MENPLKKTKRKLSKKNPLRKSPERRTFKPNPLKVTTSLPNWAERLNSEQEEDVWVDVEANIKEEKLVEEEII